MNERHSQVKVNGVRLHTVEAGEAGRPLALLLHGFPEFWYTWRWQIGPLERAGFHVVAPDLRGYNLSQKPEGVAAYQVDELVEDVAALVKHFSSSSAHVVGHDWGGVIAWALAMRRPDVVERLAILNAPHPVAYARELRRGRQLPRSWYVLFFQLPRLPEVLLGRLDVGALIQRTSARPGGFTQADLQRYREAWAQPGAWTAALNYYRALVQRPSSARPSPIQAPTLLIWGEQDVALVPQLTENLEQWVPDLRVERLPGASHWVMHDEPVRVSNLLLEFLQ